jgi:hypothetical protein
MSQLSTCSSANTWSTDKPLGQLEAAMLVAVLDGLQDMFAG